MNITFILGSHRTGSKTFANFLNNQFGQVHSIHQYDLMRWNNVLSGATLHGYLSKNFLENYLKQFWFPKLTQFPDKLYVESNGFNFYSAAFALKEFQNVTILHVIRHPATFVTSYINWYHKRMASKVANKIPFWHLEPYYNGSISKKDFQRLDFAQKMIWRWRIKNEFIADIYSKHSHYKCIRFEDFISSDNRPKVLKQTLDFLDLEYHDSQLHYFDTPQNASNNNFFPDYPNWKPEHKQFLIETCKNLMLQYNYDEKF